MPHVLDEPEPLRVQRVKRDAHDDDVVPPSLGTPSHRRGMLGYNARNQLLQEGGLDLPAEPEPSSSDVESMVAWLDTGRGTGALRQSG